MKSPKLSFAQIDALHELAEDERRARQPGGWYTTASVRNPTMVVLQKHGFASHSRVPHYLQSLAELGHKMDQWRLTDAGRAHINQG